MENKTKEPEIRLTPKQIYRAVANYLSNTLCIDKKTVENILEQKIEDRMPDKLIEKAVNRYFGQRPDGRWNTEIAVKSQIEKEIEKQVQQKMKESGTRFLNEQIQDALDEIFGRTEKKPAGAVSPRPNLTVYSGAVSVKMPLVETIVMRWMETSGLKKAGVQYELVYSEFVHGGTYSVQLSNLTDNVKKQESVQAFIAALPQDEQRELSSTVFARTETNLPAYMFASILAAELGDVFISRILADTDGIICLYD